MVKINTTDITNYINESTYKVDSVDVFASAWKDANGKTHKTLIRQKVEGSFDVVLISGYSMTMSQFKTLLNSATTNNLLTLTLSVNNLGATKTISCYYTIECSAPRKIRDNVYFEKATIKIEER